MSSEFLENSGFALQNINIEGTKNYILDERLPNVKDFYTINFQ